MSDDFRNGGSRIGNHWGAAAHRLEDRCAEAFVASRLKIKSAPAHQMDLLLAGDQSQEGDIPVNFQPSDNHLDIPEPAVALASSEEAGLLMRSHHRRDRLDNLN